MSTDKDLHRHAAENLARADALLFGRLTYVFAGLSKRIDLKLVSWLEFGPGAVAMRYENRR
jgi:hypothetical protein